jgi:hypothetical protein
VQPQAAGRELLPAKCRTSINTPVPSARRAKKSGAWRLAFPGLADPVQPHRLGRDRLNARVGVQRHQHVPLHPRLVADVLAGAGEPPPAPASSAAPGVTQSPVPGSPARTATTSRPAGRHRPALPPPIGIDVLHLNVGTRRRTPGPGRVSGVIASPVDGTNPSLAQLRWRNIANSSNPLAMAQIRWHKTTVCYVRLVLFVVAIQVVRAGVRSGARGCR